MLVTFVPVSEVSATPYGWAPGGPNMLPDSTGHSFCYYNIPAGTDRARMVDAMEYLDSATNMYDVYTASCFTSTDVVFVYQTPIPIPGIGNARGFTDCRSFVNNFFCDQARVSIDIWQIGLEATDPTNHEMNIGKTVRHEVGHTVGLSHHPPGTDAMSSGAVPSNWSFFWYTAHDIIHINCVCV